MPVSALDLQALALELSSGGHDMWAHETRCGRFESNCGLDAAFGLTRTLVAMLLLVVVTQQSVAAVPIPKMPAKGRHSAAQARSKPATSPASKPATTQPAPRAAGKTAMPEFLWKASGDKGTVYLLGTLHMVKGSFYPLPVEMEKAFGYAQNLVLEVDLTKTDETKAQKLLANKGMYLPGSNDSLSKHLSAETRKALNSYLSKQGLPTAVYDKFKPWLVGLLIAKGELQKLGFQPELGIDQHFMREARAHEKKVIGLETEEFQLNLLSGFSDELQDEMLRLNLLEVNGLKALADEMMDTWKRGDESGMDAVLTKDVKKYPELKPVHEKILYERNIDMTDKVDKMLQTGEIYFVAVGSGHMVGDRGIVALLRKKGYTVEQIKGGMPLPPPEKKSASAPPVEAPPASSSGSADSTASSGTPVNDVSTGSASGADTASPPTIAPPASSGTTIPGSGSAPAEAGAANSASSGGPIVPASTVGTAEASAPAGPATAGGTSSGSRPASRKDPDWIKP